MQKDWTMDPSSVEHVAQLMRTLSDTTRLRLLGLLTRGELNVSSLCDLLQLPQPTVSHHLGLLRSAGLVRNRRDGKQVFYALDDQAVTAQGRSGLTIQAGELELRLQVSDVEATPTVTATATDSATATAANGGGAMSAVDRQPGCATPAM